MEIVSQTVLSGSPVDTSGIDDIFDVSPENVEVVPVGDKIELPVTEAAARLGISKRTLWRRIRAGEFASRNDGRNTFVTVPVTPEKTMSQDADTPDLTSVPRHLRVPEQELTQLRADFEQAKFDLVAVTNRAQYLQGQVDLYEQQFKLLVDKQQSGSWWSRFTAWFLGVK